MEEDRYSCDVLVIGTGAAGCRAAIEASEHSADVILVAKGVFGKSGTTNLACVVYDAALGHADPEDSPQIHFEDSVIYSRFLADQDLVRIFTWGAPKTVYDLERYGLSWYKTEEGRFCQLNSPGLRYNRGVYYNESTGKKVQNALVREIKRSTRRNVRVIEDLFIFQLITGDGAVTGAVGFDLKCDRFIVIQAGSTILATGGMGMAYSVTDMEAGACGDGLAMAYDVGAELIDMELHQFFPTAFVHPSSLRGVIVTSSQLWKMGMKLYNNRGERFMARDFPEECEDVSRDILSRKIFLEIAEGRGTEHGGVWADTTDIPGFEEFKKDRPRTYIWKERFGVKTDRFEVAPTYHYTLGGIRIDTGARASVPGLYAAGEVTGGIHGGNRLAGNALPECMVFGEIAGNNAAAETRSRYSLDEEQIRRAKEKVLGFVSCGEKDEIPFSEIFGRVRELLYEKAGIIRTGMGLREAAQEVQELKALMPRIRSGAGMSGKFALARTIETGMIVRLAELVVNSCLMRTESRGAHYRTDFPETDPEWLKNVIVRTKGEEPEFSTVPVDLKFLKPGEASLHVKSADLSV